MIKVGENDMKLFAHQTEAVRRGKMNNLALFHSCGTGKTLTGIELIKYWKLMKMYSKFSALVVCPLSIVNDAWLGDCAKFAPDLDVVSLWSKKPTERLRRLEEDHDVYIANYETFKSLWPYIYEKHFDVLIVDESSKMKNPKSQITRSILAFAGIVMRSKKSKVKYRADQIIPHRYVLSGTPAPNSEEEYWSQVKFITGSGDKLFNDNFYVFRSRYFYSIPVGNLQKIWKFRKQTLEEFQNKIATVAHVVSKADAVDLPEQVHEIREVILSGVEQKAYDDLKTELVLRFEDETVLATTSLVEVMKLRQLTSGFCYGEEGTHNIGCSKLKETDSLLEEIGGHQVIIWANFKEEIRLLLELLGRDAMALWSLTVNRDTVIKGFKAGDFQYLIANPQSAAHGLTFTNCNYAIYFSQNYSYEMQKQSEDRIHRIGQDNKCTYYHLIAKGTVDRMIHNTVKSKGDVSRATLEFLKGK